MANTAYPIIAEPVGILEASTLPIVGASRRLDCNGNWVGNRDSQDTKVVNQYINNTGVSTLPGNEAGFGGFPTIANGPACDDADRDGMPDVWETARGLNPNNAADRNTVAASGYTMLEVHLNGSGDTPPPADKFATGDRVRVTSTINVRSAPGGTLLGTQPAGALGTVVAGPTTTDNGVIWWQINYDTGVDGWSGQDLLERDAADTTPPTVSITTPGSGSTVSGPSVAVSANAADNRGVASVDFKVDGVLLLTDTTAPYDAVWNTTTASNGSHVLTAVARDAAGNTTTSTGITVTVDNDKFVAGDRVRVTSTINVRSTPGGTLLGTQPTGALGTVVAGPTTTDNGVVWWQVNFDTGVDGWGGETLLERVAP